MLSLSAQLHVSRIPYTDDNALINLVDLEHPQVVFVNEFGTFDISRIVRLIFSIPSVFVRCVAVVRLHNSVVDIYDRPSTHVSAGMYHRQSIAVSTKDELINLACNVSRYA